VAPFRAAVATVNRFAMDRGLSLWATLFPIAVGPTERRSDAGGRKRNPAWVAG